MTDKLPVNIPEEDGILLMDKPYKWSSFKLVKKVRYLLGRKKTGHAGTLDPLAEGLMILCTGKATKSIEQIQAQTKVYTGSIFLGAVTDSYDLETEPKITENVIMPTEKEILQAVEQLTGEIEQTPPIYSAVKINGKRAYKYAREGSEVKMRARIVNVYEFEITGVKLPLIFFRIKCSKGTYIRSLANDLGEILNVGAYLHSLKRTQIGDYELENAFTVESLIGYLDKNETI